MFTDVATSSVDPAGKRNNRPRSSYEMASPQCPLFHPALARMRFARPPVKLTIELRRLPSFLLPSTDETEEGQKGSESIFNSDHDE